MRVKGHEGERGATVLWSLIWSFAFCVLVSFALWGQVRHLSNGYKSIMVHNIAEIHTTPVYDNQLTFHDSKSIKSAEDSQAIERSN